MGWKGTMRSLAAANRRMAKEADRHMRAMQKEAEIAEAESVFEQYEDYIKKITTLHQDCLTPLVRWTDISKSEAPAAPVYDRKQVEEAKRDLEQHRPSFWVRLLSMRDLKLEKLERLLKNAEDRDKSAHDFKMEEYRKTLEQWKSDKDLADKVLNGDLGAMTVALSRFINWNDISGIGTKISYEVVDPDTVLVTLNVHGDDIVPNEKYSLTRTGKLVTKDMPQVQFNEIYQDYVCSVVLRVADEIFHVLNVDRVIVDAVDNCLDFSTGRKAEKPILSVVIPWDTLIGLNVFDLDPSDSMRNFIHNMNFKKTSGFSPVESLTQKYQESERFLARRSDEDNILMIKPSKSSMQGAVQMN